MRGTTNRNVRGNSRDREARRRYLIKAYESDEPEHCRCYRCGKLLCNNCGSWRCATIGTETVTVDRIIPGCKGGKYVRNNIRPACARCNSATGTAAARS